MVAGARRDQVGVCERLGVAPQFVDGAALVGASRSLFDPLWPVQGMRCPPVGANGGWFLWAGEYVADPGFFAPVPALQVVDARPLIAQYLALPPGWAFAIAPGYEDTWFNEALLASPRA